MDGQISDSPVFECLGNLLIGGIEALSIGLISTAFKETSKGRTTPHVLLVTRKKKK